ncbi:MAG: FAD-binding oxidoreductase [Candidatus Helarchaeota archaeon]
MIDIKKELTKIVNNEKWVEDDPAVLWNYARDMTENEPGNPEIIVMPETIEELQKIVKFANENKISITPYVCGANVGGLAIPRKGGIVVDLKRLNKIIIDKESMYAIIEPGVTFGHLKRILDEEYPSLRYSIPMAPPFTSVVVNAIMGGLGNLSHKYGSMSDMISSLEVLLPTGELVKMGSAAISPYWFGLHPVPNIAGMFINMQGILGIVTRVGINLWPRPNISENGILFALEGPEEVYSSLIFKLSHSEICDEIAGGLFHYSLGKGLLPMDDLKGLIQSIIPIDNMEDRSYFLTWISIGASNEKELKIKWKVVNKLVNETNKKEKRNLILVRTNDFGDIGKKVDYTLDLPMQLPPMYDLREGGGLTWVGSYVPLPKWLEACNEGLKVMDKYNFLPGVLHRPMKRGHYGVLRFFIPFNKNDQDEIKTVKKICNELVDIILDVGGIPYKVPAWAASKVFERADPNYVDLLKRLKKFFDPNGIMNPGRLIF